MLHQNCQQVYYELSRLAAMPPQRLPSTLCTYWRQSSCMEWYESVVLDLSVYFWRARTKEKYGNLELARVENWDNIV